MYRKPIFAEVNKVPHGMDDDIQGLVVGNQPMGRGNEQHTVTRSVYFEKK